MADPGWQGAVRLAQAEPQYGVPPTDMPVSHSRTNLGATLSFDGSPSDVINIEVYYLRCGGRFRVSFCLRAPAVRACAASVCVCGAVEIYRLFLCVRVRAFLCLSLSRVRPLVFVAYTIQTRFTFPNSSRLNRNGRVAHQIRTLRWARASQLEELRPAGFIHPNMPL